ncbi:MAG: single-stranded DNA-binding protein [Acidobacteriaceae bacterium]|nr:single-stranded DNA-binding protein [Acidobacteriaceae bacterium]
MGSAATQSEKIEGFLQTLVRHGRFNLKYKITCNGKDDSGDTAAAKSSPEIAVAFTGPDVSLLLARNGELLLAIEHMAAKILRFEHEEHDRIFFDADNFKILRQQELRMAAEVAIERVRTTGRPFSFAPMSSRERRILHMELASSGLTTASSGEGSRRFVVLYPEGVKQESATEVRSAAIRNTFRRR